jgi:hypothetical protein
MAILHGDRGYTDRMTRLSQTGLSGFFVTWRVTIDVKAHI